MAVAAVLSNLRVEMDFQQLDDQVQVSPDGRTVWVHSLEGSTVGRFSKAFGIDAHTTVTQQLAGAAQCLHCTHTKPDHADWVMFCKLMLEHHGIHVDQAAIDMSAS